MKATVRMWRILSNIGEIEVVRPFYWAGGCMEAGEELLP
jgi:hypothetical protein